MQQDRNNFETHLWRQQLWPLLAEVHAGLSLQLQRKLLQLIPNLTPLATVSYLPTLWPTLRQTVVDDPRA